MATAEDQTPLVQLAARLPQMTAQAGHGEMWGVELADAARAPVLVVLQKFLRANNDDVAAAEKQLTAALEWRKAVNPAALAAQAFDARRFGGLGFVTVHRDDAAARDLVVTWNIYGAVRDNKATFGDVHEYVGQPPFPFPPLGRRVARVMYGLTHGGAPPHTCSFIRWRAALMELGVQKLRLGDAAEPLVAGAEDPFRMIQVHDYQSVSFWRMDPDVKVASRETIRVFSLAYPELLSHKYFVNVPAVMGWVFGAMKLFLAPATLAKFHPMSSGAGLAVELAPIASTLPSEYGGGGPSVKSGLSVRLTDDEEAPGGQATTDKAAVPTDGVEAKE